MFAADPKKRHKFCGRAAKFPPLFRTSEAGVRQIKGDEK